MTVGDIVASCEFVGCMVLDALGNEIEVTKDNFEEIYKMSVEHLSAKDNLVMIWTFEKFDEEFN